MNKIPEQTKELMNKVNNLYGEVQWYRSVVSPLTYLGHTVDGQILSVIEGSLIIELYENDGWFEYEMVNGGLQPVNYE